MKILIFRFKQEVTPERQNEIIEQIGRWTNINDSISGFSSNARKVWLLVNDSEVNAIVAELGKLDEIESDIGPVNGPRFDV